MSPEALLRSAIIAARSAPKNAPKEPKEAKPKTVIVEFAQPVPIPVHVETPRERIIRLSKQYAERTAPVYSSIPVIIRTVAIYYNTPELGIVGQRRTKKVTLVRHIAMYLCRELTPDSFAQIARRFDNRDHSTIVNGARKIAALYESDPELRAQIDDIKLLIGAVAE